MNDKKSRILDYEMDILKSYMKLPSPKLLRHRFELDTDYLAGHVSRFLKGERFSYEMNIFTPEEVCYIRKIINENNMSDDGVNLDITISIIETVCKIINKYKI